MPDKIEGIKDQCFAAGTSNGNRQATSERRRNLEGVGSLGIATKVKGETLFGATSGINDNHGVGSGSVVLDVGIPNQVSHVLECRDIGDMALRGSLPTAILRRVWEGVYIPRCAAVAAIEVATAWRCCRNDFGRD